MLYFLMYEIFVLILSNTVQSLSDDFARIFSGIVLGDFNRKELFSEMIKEKTVCFTGHRPEKLPGYGEQNSGLLNMLRSMLYYRIYMAAQSGYEYFISGLARGVDLWAADSVIDIQKKFPNIKLICAKPYSEHGNTFKGEDLWSLNNVLEKAHEIICVSNEYSRDCYKNRNQFMVDNSSCLIGVVDNFKSGTGQTIAYARKKGLELSLIKVADVASATGYVEKKSQIIFD